MQMQKGGSGAAGAATTRNTNTQRTSSSSKILADLDGKLNFNDIDPGKLVNETQTSYDLHLCTFKTPILN
jgi:hypothetical protein